MYEEEAADHGLIGVKLADDCETDGSRIEDEQVRSPPWIAQSGIKSFLAESSPLVRERPAERGEVMAEHGPQLFEDWPVFFGGSDEGERAL